MTPPGWHRAHYLFGAFLALFGLTNFAELPLKWKDRTEQFTRYLDRTVGLDGDWVGPALWAVKSVELVLGLVAVVAVARRRADWLAVASAGWMALFTGMTVMDVWAADRAELQEHTLYFGGFSLVLIAVLALAAADRVAAVVRRLES